MNQYYEYFTNYINDNYDMNNELIKIKYYHSLRVAKLMYILAKRLHLSDMDTLLALKIGLCHDLGRFYEVVRNGVFNNLIFDHGAYSNKVLYNDGLINYFDIEQKDNIVIRKALYYHNKKDLGNDLNDKESLFANMIRDMDKLDIIEIRSNRNKMVFNKEPSLIVLDNYFNNQSIDIKNIHGSNDSVVLYLSFIKDLYFDASYDLANEGNYIVNLLNIIEMSDNMHLTMDKLLMKIKERGMENVRKKI